MDDVIETIADALGLPLDAAVQIVGAPWQRLDGHRHDEEGEWFLAGEPPQALLGLSLTDIAVAVPVGRWQGHRLVYVPDEVHVQLPFGHPDLHEDLKSALAQVERKRRATFFYCRYCRDVTPPEHGDADNVCMGCAERWQGLVH